VVSRLKEVGLQPLGLEIRQYTEEILSVEELEELKEGRLFK